MRDTFFLPTSIQKFTTINIATFEFPQIETIWGSLCNNVMALPLMG